MTMKKLIAMILTVGLFAAVSGSAFAEMRGGYYGHGGSYGHGGYYGYGPWGFFAGLVGGAILGTALSHSYEQPYAPAPRVYSAPPPEQVWVPGRYETRYERQWVPGRWEVEADRYSGAHRVWIPGHYEDVPAQVWLAGHWEERG
jgi:hypothetical protein